MRSGVPGFQPIRLEQAMRARGLNQVGLAQLIGKSAATISKWKSGHQLPERDALDRLSQALNLEGSLFLRPVPVFGDAPRFNRSMASATQQAREKASGRLEWAEELCLIFSEWVDLPEVRLHSLYEGQALSLITDGEIEEAAIRTRQQWKLGLGPVSNVVLALENAGIVVVREEIGFLKLDGTSHWLAANQRPFVFLVADKANGVRGRFDAAHELGHIVLHRGVSQSEFFESFSEIERHANIFAGAFLLPAESFGVEISSVPTLDMLAALKRRWRVSVAAMIMRCSQLEILDKDQAARLWKHYSARGWRRKEPYDEDVTPELPRLLSRAARLLIEENVLSRDALIRMSGFSAGDIESLTNLPEGFLANDRGQVIDLKEVRLRRQP